MTGTSQFKSSGQVENRNLLSKLSFRFTFQKAPKLAFYAEKINIPSISLGVAMQPSYLTSIPHPGDKMEFGDLNVTFKVDEDFTNYMEIQNWIRGLGYPESLKQHYDWQCSFNTPNAIDLTGGKGSEDGTSDGTLLVQNSNRNTNFQIVYRRMFPIYLSDLIFDSTLGDMEYHTADVTFKYMVYNIRGKYGQHLPKDYDL